MKKANNHSIPSSKSIPLWPLRLCLFSLSILLFGLITPPPTVDNALVSATTSNSGDVTFEAIINPYISLGLSTHLATTNITPTDTFTFGSTDPVQATVSTNNRTGFMLTINPESTDMTNQDESAFITDKMYDDETAEDWVNGLIADCGDNNDYSCQGEYGFASDNSALFTKDHFYPFNFVGNYKTILQQSSPAYNAQTSITFAAVVHNTIPAGQYSITIIFSAIANLDSINQSRGVMQEQTAATCSDLSAYTDTFATYQMTDSRDGEVYSVRKLDDGNCWMTNNLRLKGGTTITPADSDVSSSYTLPASYLYFGNNSTNEHYRSTLEYEYDGDPSSENYLNFGSYYSFNTATAGTGLSLTSEQNAPSSICPKNWKLPTRSQFVSLIGGNIYDILDTPNVKENFSFIDLFNFQNAGTYQDASKITNSGGTYISSTVSYGAGASIYAGLYRETDSHSTIQIGGNSNNTLNFYGNSVRCVLPASSSS